MKELKLILRDAGAGLVLIILGLGIFLIAIFIGDSSLNPLIKWLASGLLSVAMIFGIWMIWDGLKAPIDGIGRRRLKETLARANRTDAEVRQLMESGLTISQIARRVDAEPLYAQMTVNRFQDESDISSAERKLFSAVVAAVKRGAKEDRPFKRWIKKDGAIVQRPAFCKVQLNDDGAIEFKSRIFRFVIKMQSGVEVLRVVERDGDFGELLSLLARCHQGITQHEKTHSNRQ
jgi:hypothetical protein